MNITLDILMDRLFAILILLKGMMQNNRYEPISMKRFYCYIAIVVLLFYFIPSLILIYITNICLNYLIY